MVQDGCVFLGERLNPNDNPGVLCFPGGKLDEGEQPMRGAIRELVQETGILVNKLTPIGVIKLYNPDFGDYMSYGYILEVPTGQRPERTEEHKTGEWKKYPLSHVLQMPDAKLLAGTKLFIETAQRILNRTPSQEIV